MFCKPCPPWGCLRKEGGEKWGEPLSWGHIPAEGAQLLTGTGQRGVPWAGPPSSPEPAPPAGDWGVLLVHNSNPACAGTQEGAGTRWGWHAPSPLRRIRTHEIPTHYS